MGLAWLLVQVTANPYFGPALAGLKFAWEDIRVAFWLRRRDPLAHRGQVGFWVYLTWALIQVFVAAAPAPLAAPVLVAWASEDRQLVFTVNDQSVFA